MNTAANLALATAVFGPGLAIAVPVLLSQRGAKADSQRVQAILAVSAAERAAALAEQDEDDTTPPPAREPAPELAPASVEQLATVLNFPARHAA